MNADHPLVEGARTLGIQVGGLRFSAPVTHVYNPLDYAWATHERYLRQFGNGRKRVVFVGMNPGPFGMVQTGVPFGEVAMVRDWMGIDGVVGVPSQQNPKRPVEGFACTRSEVSGRRLWGLFRDRFGTIEAFMSAHFVANYCPLAFFAEGRNVTPDKLSAAEAAPLFAACDAHLHTLVEHTRTRLGDRRRRVGREARRRGGRGSAGTHRACAPPQPGQPGSQSRLGRGGDAAARRAGCVGRVSLLA